MIFVRDDLFPLVDLRSEFRESPHLVFCQDWVAHNFLIIFSEKARFFSMQQLVGKIEKILLS